MKKTSLIVQSMLELTEKENEISRLKAFIEGQKIRIQALENLINKTLINERS